MNEKQGFYNLITFIFSSLEVDVDCMSLNNFMNHLSFPTYIQIFNILLELVPGFKKFLIEKEILTQDIPGMDMCVLDKLYFILRALHGWVLNKTFHDVTWQVNPLQI